nr:hypothetical protein BaRGS_004266 [Batillaria attramentaria]
MAGQCGRHPEIFLRHRTAVYAGLAKNANRKFGEKEVVKFGDQLSAFSHSSSYDQNTGTFTNSQPGRSRYAVCLRLAWWQTDEFMYLPDKRCIPTGIPIASRLIETKKRLHIIVWK